MPFGQGNPIYANQGNHIPAYNPHSNQGPREQLRQPPRVHHNSYPAHHHQPVYYQQPGYYANPPAYYPVNNYHGHTVIPNPHAGHSNRMFRIFLAVFIAVPVMAIAELPPIFVFAALTLTAIRMMQISNRHQRFGCQGC